MPKVSIIIPTYNRAHLIGRAIKSVLNQTYQDFEIIVVDDGSTDNMEEVVKKFQKKNKRIRYIRHKENKGEAAARNTGIKAAKGEYIAFQDSDDEWFPEKLEKQMEVFESAPSKVGVVYTGFYRVKNNKKTYIPSSWVKQKEGDIHKELLKGNFVGTPAMVVKKECFEKVGMFDENLPQLEDWELVIRLSKYYEFKCIDEPLMIAHYTPGSVNEQPADIHVKTIKLVIEKYFKDLSQDKKLLSKYYFSIGTGLCSNGDFQKGKDYLIKAVKTYPLNIKLLLITFLSFLGQDMYNRVVKVYRKIRSA